MSCGEADRFREAIAPDVMGADYKGWFLLGDGMRCDPLTISDLHSRFVMKTELMPDMTVKWTQREFRDVFK